jgi:hypothetical protein
MSTNPGEDFERIAGELALTLPPTTLAIVLKAVLAYAHILQVRPRVDKR